MSAKLIQISVTEAQAKAMREAIATWFSYYEGEHYTREMRATSQVLTRCDETLLRVVVRFGGPAR